MTTQHYPHERFEPRLSDRQRFELAGASLKNAIDLRDDAVALNKEGRVQRAGFLLHVCLEEVLKAYLCLTMEPKDDAEWSRFWETFRHHRRKLALLKETEWGSREEHDAGNRMLRTFRERALYVEVSEAGDPLTPMGLVDPGEMGPETIELQFQAINDRLGREIDRLKRAEPTMRGPRTPKSSPEADRSDS